MDSTTFNSEEALSDHVPEGSIVKSVKYNGSVETVVYVTPDGVGRDELVNMSRSQLYSFGKEIGVELRWSGEEAHSKEEMIEAIAETEGEE